MRNLNHFKTAYIFFLKKKGKKDPSKLAFLKIKLEAFLDLLDPILSHGAQVLLSKTIKVSRQM